MKYANDLVLLAKEEMVLQGINDKTTEVGRCYGMEVNVEKNKHNYNITTIIPNTDHDRSETNGECGTLQLSRQLHNKLCKYM